MGHGHDNLFADDLARHGDRPAVVSAHGTVTYAELDRLVADVAARLGPIRRLVLVEASNTLGALVAYLGALRGRHPVLLAAGDDLPALEALIGAYEPDVVARTGSTCELQERREGTGHDLHPDLALLLSTSGSTGSPKLVRLSRENLGANATSIAGYLGLTAADRAVTTLPMQYCYGLSVINSHLSVGASVVLTDLSVVDRCFWDLLRATEATSFAGVPHTFDLLDRVGFEAMAVPSLRYLTQAGGRMQPDKVRRFAEQGHRQGWELFVMYGQTEATARMAYLPPSLTATRPQAIGRAIPGGSLTIEAPNDDGVGELVYRGANVMMGYAEAPADLAAGADLDALHTGDLARMASDGLFEVVGRRSRFIKPYGLRVDLDRMEGLLAERGVAAVCTGDDDALVVAVTGPDHVEPATRAVLDHVAIPRSHVTVVAMPEIPRLDNGKPDYRALRSAAGQQQARSSGAGGACPVRAAFAAVLGAEPDDDDTFVSLGGDSLSYVEMSVRLERVLGSLPRDWHTTPVGQLVPAAAPQPSRRRRLAATETSAVLRAAAIVLIVGTHAKVWHLPGGAHALLAVAGYNFARFQLRVGSVFASVARIAVPSMCWIGAVAAVSDVYSWPNVLLVNGFFGDPADRFGYWFIEVLVLTLLGLGLLLAIPSAARLEGRRPFAMPVAAVAAGLLVRFDLIDIATTRRTSRPQEVFWIFALGWAASRASSWPQRLLVTALAAVGLHGFFGDGHRELLVLAGLAATVWLPVVALPRLVQRLVAPLAGASLHIYLIHFQLYPPVARTFGRPAAVVAALLVGTLAWYASRGAMVRAELLYRSLRSKVVASAGSRLWPAGSAERSLLGWR